MITPATPLLGAASASALLPRSRRAPPTCEPPYLRPLIEAGKLPELASACPKSRAWSMLPRMGREPGGYGGVVRTLIGGQKDIRMMTINGYARLVGSRREAQLPAPTS